jgi:hypothetical protein
MSLSEALLCLLLIALQSYVSLGLLGLKPVWWKVISFTLLQTSSVVLFTHILPYPAPQFLAISVTHVVYFMWVFKVDLFPEALACYLIPLASVAAGDILLGKFFQNQSFEPYLHNIMANRVGPPLSFAPYVPTLLLTVYLLSKRLRAGKNDEGRNNSRPDSMEWLIACAAIAIFCYLRCPSLTTHSNNLMTNLFLGGCLFTLPLLLITAHQYINKEMQTGKSLQYHVKQHAVQKLAIKTLREERHEFINELTLISTYLQTGKIEEALACIDYSAAKLADRNNYGSLPQDAWLTVLELKQKEAQDRHIDFQVDLRADAPSCFEEQRLLPKLIINLVDNAFSAVSSRSNPRVRLSWDFTPTGDRVLKVTNNGPEISAWDGKMIFRGGVTTKKDPAGNHGWGLVICRDISRELKGSLTFESSPEETSFVLTLPPENVGEQLLAN